ncbi:MAG: hypothetical protein ACKO6C_02815 [Alphaproteobacteria bacterium]
MKYYRKQIYLFFLAISVIFSTQVFAQDVVNAPTSFEGKKSKISNKELRKKRYENASPEQKIRMEKRQEILSKLSKEQRELLKQENERHHQEVKKITGYDPSEI